MLKSFDANLNLVISELFIYLIHSFKDLCEKCHGNSTRAELDEVKNYLEMKMWSIKFFFNNTKGSVVAVNKMSDGVYLSSNLLCSKIRKTHGTIHI